MKKSKCAVLTLTLVILLLLKCGGVSVDVNGVSDSVQRSIGRVLPKTVFSSKLRLVMWVGLEGTGHNYIMEAFTNAMSANGELQGMPAGRKLRCPVSWRLFTVEDSMAGNPANFAKSIESAHLQMKVLASREPQLAPPGAVYNLCARLSYPRNIGPQKVMQYFDFDLLAQVAEAEGVDLRIVFLKRSAHDLMVANTIHRRIGSWIGLGREGPSPAADLFMEYSRVLFTDIAVMHSFLAGLDPKFVVCHDYEYVGDPEQGWAIAEFVAPTPELAHAINASLVESAVRSSHGNESLEFGDAELVAGRLQRKLDVFEPTYCTR